MRKTTMPDRIRVAFAGFAPGAEVTLAQLAAILDLVFDKDKLPMRAALKDMRKTGEVVQVRRGVVVYKGKTDTKPDMRSAMWRVIRMRKNVTIADMQELTGAGAEHARDFMQLLVRRGSAERIRRPDRTVVYRLVKDTGPDTPDNSEKADRLRAIRESKKRALAKLDQAGEAIMTATEAIIRARMEINDIPEEADHGNDQ